MLLSDALAARCGQGLFVFGVNGAQGSGKSTLAGLLAYALRVRHGLRAAVLSLDDLYLSAHARARLAARVHPLLATRGVPGTHDVALGMRLLRRLGATRLGCVRLPRFDKGQDEPCPRARWPVLSAPLDVLIFEGWCVGVPAQPEAALRVPVNRLEREQDASGVWRAYVNRRLATDYQRLFGRIDALLYLRAPSWRAILRWRMRQEAMLPATARMDRSRLAWFVRHFERLTRHAMQVLPETAQIVFTLDEQHAIGQARYRI
ncbi:MAG: kinase [Zetaproteobacteria bacterium]|nr:MAG: kinase [Zetaproteobacteria bacterium]